MTIRAGPLRPPLQERGGFSYVERYLRAEKPYGPTGDDGRAAVQVMDAGYESARTGATVILS